MGLLENKVALITGGTTSLGFGIAQDHIQEGASVVVASRSATAVEHAVEELGANGGLTSGLIYDVSDLEQVHSLAIHARERFWGLHIWINNARVSPAYGPTIHIPNEQVENTLHTNIMGVYYGSLAALEHFLLQRQGKLINLLGRGECKSVAMQNTYASSKA